MKSNISENKLTMITYAAALLEANNAKGRRDDHAFGLVVRRRDTFEGLEPAERLFATIQFMRKHAPNNTPEDFGWSSEVVRAVTGSGVHTLAHKASIFY